MILFMDIFNKNNKPESAEDICKKFLKNVIVNETSIGTKQFRKNLYKNLINYGIWNNYDFCINLDEDDFIAKSKYKKQSDIKLVFEIQSKIKEEHFPRQAK